MFQISLFNAYDARMVLTARIAHAVVVKDCFAGKTCWNYMSLRWDDAAAASCECSVGPHKV